MAATSCQDRAICRHPVRVSGERDAVGKNGSRLSENPECVIRCAPQIGQVGPSLGGTQQQQASETRGQDGREDDQRQRMPPEIRPQVFSRVRRRTTCQYEGGDAWYEKHVKRLVLNRHHNQECACDRVRGLAERNQLGQRFCHQQSEQRVGEERQQQWTGIMDQRVCDGEIAQHDRRLVLGSCQCPDHEPREREKNQGSHHEVGVRAAPDPPRGEMKDAGREPDVHECAMVREQTVVDEVCIASDDEWRLRRELRIGISAR